MNPARPRLAIVLATGCVVAIAMSACGESVLDVLASDAPLDGGGGEGAVSGEGGGLDASADVDLGDAPGLRCADALPVNHACTHSTDCCSGFCAPSSTTVEATCRPATGCLGVGSSCARAGACCSNGCFSTDAGGVASGTCAGEAACFVAGGACNVDHECCSQHCAGGVCTSAAPGCKPAGETCTGDMTCCGRVCVGQGDSVLTCALLQGCRPEGETCTTAVDCCTQRCDADATGVLRCTSLAACTSNDKRACSRLVGDVCTDANQCCSRVCVATNDGTKRCAASGGCRSECELCATSADCCSGACGLGSDGVNRCQPASACGKPGEVCDKDPDCCAATGISKCLPDPSPGGPKRCHVAGTPACVAEGAACALTSECCTGRCVPGSNGSFACRSECLGYGSPCAARADCCGVDVDCVHVAGALVCAPIGN